MEYKQKFGFEKVKIFFLYLVVFLNFFYKVVKMAVDQRSA